MAINEQLRGGNVLPSRILYTMIRVSDLDRSVAFYRDLLGMRELRRETFTEGRFTLVFMGYEEVSPHAWIELTYNWDQDSYELGTGYGHVALEVDDIYAAFERLEQAGVSVVLRPGPMTIAPDETGHREVIAFIEDPDGYKIELIQAAVH
ncbi:lactoylglutathione lyase [Candidatus Thiodiazotropha endoloripes]|uniref:lactoylglutathione lyase n=1 Tax=Candidatus Thiodiazotropha endoloripes TaxID=1818881 RepID=UPI00083D8B0D|nr:lactoylglutathione lyase [Candidatus Thiodiazotropha endoloripes]MCG7984637.1 lactoylglutathione lyase [Candidatus Thiodiazotropha lotti]ODB85703.1 lactoylglutathione lyase [Candidatus Thiodiazotropha endoloripes]